MSHSQQRAYTERIAERFPEHFRGKRVLDIGSLDINGSSRYLFSQCQYTGMDVVPGRNVEVCDPRGAGVWLNELPPERYDTVISCECFEHDAHLAVTLPAIVRALKPGGLFLFTAATTGRGEHGTNRSKPWDAPGLPWPDHYENVTEALVRSLIDCDAAFSQYAFEIGHETSDLYFFGIKG